MITENKKNELIDRMHDAIVDNDNVCDTAKDCADVAISFIDELKQDNKTLYDEMFVKTSKEQHQIKQYIKEQEFMQKRIDELEDAMIFIRGKMNPYSEVYKKADYILNPFR